jgi:hemerythrin-like metal-binding protein
MKLEWSSKMETGIEVIDLQHQFLIELIGRIQETFLKAKDKNQKSRLIRELQKFMDFHTLSEENIATSLSLPGVPRLRERHVILMDEFDHHATQLQDGVETFDKFLQFLFEWFAGHTYHEDREFFKGNGWR